MRALEIAVGQRFGRWTVVLVERRKGALVKCDCGRTKNVKPWSLVSGRSRSCGCLVVETKTTHGMSRTKIYQRWRSMLNRCAYPSDQNYRYYGGRGIKVCDRWHDFENFIADMGTPPDDRMQLDRIDNDGNYELGNVRWASRQDQIRNRYRHVGKRSDSDNRFRGVIRKSAKRWGARIGIDGRFHWLGTFDTEEAAARAYDAVARLYKGWYLNFPEETSR